MVKLKKYLVYTASSRPKFKGSFSTKEEAFEYRKKLQKKSPRTGYWVMHKKRLKPLYTPRVKPKKKKKRC